MRIAHVTATFPPYYGGTGTVCYHNALGLARLGHDVTVYTADDADDAVGGYVYPDGIEVRHLRAPFRVGNAPLMPGLLGIEGFDIIHLHYPFYFGGEMVLWKSLVGRTPYVVTYHQDVLFTGLLQFPERAHHRLLGTRILERSDKVLATSMDYARASRLKTLLKKRPAAVDELPNGVDEQRFHPGVDGTALRPRYGLTGADRIVLFVGALDQAHYFKGVGNLLQAMAQIPDEGIKLLLVGDGNLREAYQAQADALELGGRVRFCGRVSAAELPAPYALCGLLVLPSTTMGEAFGVVLLEAMACGKPVIASNLPGVRSVVEEGKNGYLVEPGDVEELRARIELLLGDRQRGRKMGEQGRAKVEKKYAWPTIIPRLEQIYKNVLSNGHTGD